MIARSCALSPALVERALSLTAFVLTWRWVDGSAKLVRDRRISVPMDIHSTSRRPNADAPSLAADAKSPSVAPGVQPGPSGPPSESSNVAAPAAIQELSKAALFLGLLAVLESKHPDEAVRLLLRIAAELHAEARQPGSTTQGLDALADRFRLAAQTGDLSSLLPRERPAAHFGVRAYQAAEQATAEPTALDATFGLPTSSVLRSRTLATLSSEIGATLAQSTLERHALGRAQDSAGGREFFASLDPTTTRRSEYALLEGRQVDRAARRQRRRRHQLRRLRRRWRRT
jgi:hypothetical protein